MSKRSINEWDASDASDDDDGLKTPKTPGSPVSKPEAEGLKYSDVSPSYNPTSPTAYMNSKEDRAYEARREMAEKIEAKKEQDRLKTPAALAKRDADYAKLMPLFNAAGLKLPKVNDNNWWSHNRTLHTQIDEDQKKIRQDEATLRRKRDAHGAAHMFERVYHA